MGLFRRPKSTSDETALPPDPTAIAAGYHQRTKHHLHRFAASLGYLDWDSQPDPFRRWLGAELLPLPLPPGASEPPPGAVPHAATAPPPEPAATPPASTAAAPPTTAPPARPLAAASPEPSWDDLHRRGAVAPLPLDRAGLSRFLFHALALSAWKRFQDSRWSLRVNPSSGNLHPTEGWLLLPPVPDVCARPALFHYAPKEHGLERRASYPPAAAAALAEALPAGSFLVALSSIAWREGWKYGERAWRYCQHDAGHALAGLAYAAALCGWRLVAAPAVPDEHLALLLGLDREGDQHQDEPESPELLAVVLTGEAAGDDELLRRAARFRPGDALLAAAREAVFAGRANVLSADHHPWDVIGVVDHACRKPATLPADWLLDHAGTAAASPLANGSAGEVPAARLLRQRRSAVALDGRTSMSREAFLTLLAATLPARSHVPWEALPWPSFVHLLLFVHRVDGLSPGLYALPRTPDAQPRLAAACRKEFRWEPVGGDVPLHLLAGGDVRAAARTVSCQQDIAADGAFSLGMVAEFDGPLRRLGAPLYRHLFWETGAIGQALYLGAEAAGLRGTGIGCFFDDAVHQVFGLADAAFQSLYHFTAGAPVEDGRLTTEPAYPARD